MTPLARNYHQVRNLLNAPDVAGLADHDKVDFHRRHPQTSARSLSDGREVTLPARGDFSYIQAMGVLRTNPALRARLDTEGLHSALGPLAMASVSFLIYSSFSPLANPVNPGEPVYLEMSAGVAVKGNSVFRPYFFLPYIGVSTPEAASVGRELFGFPKVPNVIKMRAEDGVVVARAGTPEGDDVVSLRWSRRRSFVTTSDSMPKQILVVPRVAESRPIQLIGLSTAFTYSLPSGSNELYINPDGPLGELFKGFCLLGWQVTSGRTFVMDNV